MALKQYLVRVAVDGVVVGGVLENGTAEWEELDTLKSFVERHLTPSMIGSNQEVETTVGVDIELIGVPSGVQSGEQVSARITFAVEERVQQ